MDNDQIIALAREYAEEINPTNQLKDYPEAKMIADMMRNALSEVIDEKIKDFEGFVRFLLRRYALVEKEKVIAELKAVDLSIKASLTFILKVTGVDIAKKELLHSLFPEIAKEVE